MTGNDAISINSSYARGLKGQFTENPSSGVMVDAQSPWPAPHHDTMTAVWENLFRLSFTRRVYGKRVIWCHAVMVDANHAGQQPTMTP